MKTKAQQVTHLQSGFCLFKEIAKMSSTLQSVATNVSTIKETTTELKATVTSMQQSLAEVETRIERLEETPERPHADGDKRNKLVDAM